MTDFKTTRTAPAEAFTDDDHAVPSAPQMDAWTMSTSILVGINQAIRRAEEERSAILAKHNGNPFAPGVSTPTQIIEALIDARRALAPQLHATAKSSGLAMPEGV